MSKKHKNNERKVRDTVFLGTKGQPCIYTVVPREGQGQPYIRIYVPLSLGQCPYTNNGSRSLPLSVVSGDTKKMSRRGET